jgi:hypothetical protein
MTWFEDLTAYSYLPTIPATSAPALNVAWLEPNHWFPQGAVSNALVVRLGALVEHARTQATRGWHFCNLCPPTGMNNINWSTPNESHPCGNAEIRAVAADGTRYAAPTLVQHSVTVHKYSPPQAFVDAVLRTGIDWDSARSRDLRMACGSTMKRTRSAHAHRGSRREPVVAVWFRCATCDTDYDRVWPLEQERS